jgi:hypothetical protein
MSRLRPIRLSSGRPQSADQREVVTRPILLSAWSLRATSKGIHGAATGSRTKRLGACETAWSRLYLVGGVAYTAYSCGACPQRHKDGAWP